MKYVKRSIFALLLILIISCEDNNDHSKEDLANFKNKVVNTFDLDTNYLSIYSYPSEGDKIKISVNSTELKETSLFCDSLPGCLIASIKKTDQETKIYIQVNNQTDSLFTIKNSEVYKIIFGVNDGQLTIYTNKDKYAWAVEY